MREPFEFEIARIDGAQLIPLGDLPHSLDHIPHGGTTVVYCKTGLRSAHAIAFLRGKGFHGLLNLSGGIDAWRAQIDPALRKY